MKKRPKRPRVFELEDLDGFYVGNGICVHLTLEEDNCLVIDIFDDERAGTPFHGDKGNIIGKPIVVNLMTAEVSYEN